VPTLSQECTGVIKHNLTRLTTLVRLSVDDRCVKRCRQSTAYVTVNIPRCIFSATMELHLKRLAHPAGYTVDLNVFDVHKRISSDSHDKQPLRARRYGR
jgi:hypothetical protein